ncbi:hypothetical protein D3273_26695 [Lichenibacterium minor]|uniref:Lipopolysaccharide biosynthesis protein n=1 Tax=Lichenibacterium minor TaxID=2316528 RepID=A0A4Q2TZY2_9HYPH|nr:oligosaccharide flippase family protein [Lichenibacterium minor]RYC28918.1 hypothetical protein D3273_26695 [Lichenibacterium minor]
MADFFPIVQRAVLRLDEPTEVDRDAVYARAREALQQFTGLADATFEARALDDAIARVEAKFAKRPALALGAELASGPTEAAPSRRQFAFNAGAAAAVNIFKTLLQLALLPVMARLLGPEAYGVYALAFPTVMFFLLLGDGGLGMSLSREDESNSVVWSTAFWTLLGTCTVMALGVMGAGFVLARVSGQPSLVGLMTFLSAALPLLALSLPAGARLQRRGNLLYHSGSDLLGSVAGAAVALALAFNGAGVWALAAQHVTLFAFKAIILNAAAWSPPDLVYDFASLRGHVATGGALLVSRLGELGTKLAENTVFGHIFGTVPLGSYMFANQVSRFTCEAITNPVVGAFYAQALRESDDEVAALHARLTRMLLLVLFPTTALMAVAAPDVFPLILGNRWGEAGPLFQAMVVAYALAAAAWLSGQILMKHGMTDRSAKVVVACGVARVTAVVAGLWLPPIGVAWLVGASYALQAVAMTLAVPRGFGSSLSSLVATLWGPAIAATAGGAVSASVISRFPGSVTSALAASALGGSLYFALLFALDGQALRDDIVGLTRVVRRRAA